MTHVLRAAILLALTIAASGQERSTRVEVILHPGFARTRVVETWAIAFEPPRGEAGDLVAQVYVVHPDEFELLIDELLELPSHEGVSLPRPSPEQLASWIEEDIAPGSWNRPCRIRPFPKALFISHVPAVHESIRRYLNSLDRRGPTVRSVAPADALAVEAALEDRPSRRVVVTSWIQPHSSGDYTIPWRPGPYDVSIELVTRSPIASLEVDPPWPLEVAWSGPNRVTIEGSVPGGGLRLRYP